MAAERDVGGGEADGAAPCVAMRHDAADRPGAAQHGRRAFGIAVLQGTADARGGDLPGRIHQRRDHGKPDAEGFGAGGEESGIAAAAMAEGEIGAANQMPGADAGVEHVGHERFGRHRAERPVERQFVERGDPQGRQGGGAFGRQGEPERRIVGAEDLARVRLEGEDGERRVGACAVAGAEQVGVAAVNAVEIAQRNDSAAGGLGEVLPVGDDAHGRGAQPRAGGRTTASPSITVLPATVQVVFRVACFLAGSMAMTSQVAITVSPILTGRRKRSVCAR